jgi:hypothetical protein
VQVAVLMSKRGARRLDLADGGKGEPLAATLIERAEAGDGAALAAALGFKPNKSRKTLRKR